MAINPKTYWISEEDYLQSELISETKHEYMDGQVYAMTGSTPMRWSSVTSKTRMNITQTARF